MTRPGGASRHASSSAVLKRAPPPSFFQSARGIATILSTLILAAIGLTRIWVFLPPPDAVDFMLQLGTANISSGIPSGILSGIHSNISSGISLPPASPEQIEGQMKFSEGVGIPPVQSSLDHKINITELTPLINNTTGATPLSNISGASSRFVPQQAWMFHPEAQFVSFSAYRMTSQQFALIGHTSTKDLVIGANDTKLSCSWTYSRGGVDHVIKGKVMVEYNLANPAYVWWMMILTCSLDEPPVVIRGDGDAAKEESFGTFAIQVNDFSMLARIKDVEPLPSNSTGPYKNVVALCGPPMKAHKVYTLVAEAILRWVQYQQFVVGFDHMFFYNVDVFTDALRSTLSDYSAVITVLELSEAEGRHESFYYGQVTAMNDCVYHNRETSGWVAFADFDEYFVIKKLPSAAPTLRGFLQENYPRAVTFDTGSYWFRLTCKDSKWRATDTTHALELMTTRETGPYCRKEERPEFGWDHCPTAYGHRKFIANPRLACLVHVHDVQHFKKSIFSCEWTKVISLSTNDIYRAHYRGLPFASKCDTSITDSQKNLRRGQKTLESYEVADFARRVRECTSQHPGNSPQCFAQVFVSAANRSL